VLLFALPQYVSLPYLENLDIWQKSGLRRPRPPGSVNEKNGRPRQQAIWPVAASRRRWRLSTKKAWPKKSSPGRRAIFPIFFGKWTPLKIYQSNLFFNSMVFLFK